MVNSNPASVCPPVKEYDRAFQTKLANELEQAPEGAASVIAIQDYAALRNQLKVCH